MARLKKPPTSRLELSIPQDLRLRLELFLPRDALTGKIAHGAWSDLIVSLLHRHLKEISHDTD